LRAKLGLNFPLRLLFENPTVAGMSSALIQPMLEHLDEQEAITIVEEVEALSDKAAREQRSAQAIAANDAEGTTASGARL
jgi:hypothetical protein